MSPRTTLWPVPALDKTIAYPVETSLNLGGARLQPVRFLLAMTALPDLSFLSRRQR